MSTANISWLFETAALKIAPSDSPFWYTSGLIGPYYVNTQFLCGGAQKAAEVLALIDAEQDKHASFASVMAKTLDDIYATHTIYHDLIDLMVASAGTEFPIAEVDYISGGQRRDWFFAPIVAKKLNKPMLYIYNDQSIYAEDGSPVTSLPGKKVLNVADLLTVGSSYTDKWIPGLAKAGAILAYSLNGVDRLQGGVANLTAGGIEKVHSLFAIQLSLFDQALSQNYIDQGQYDMVRDYISDPFQSMRSFLVAHPEFLEKAQAADEKTQARARKLIGDDLYRLKS
ncbi:hypothetical protein AUK40_06340 [Candidatus Wirthbacteria bacterium CG2_30_54_11]|uniref:Orotate phosphoribosyltransferase n=1 Tax=Candidatus Wirthbacteria bacterium CG2_30_54_11 TaxID=1817892 RepID=A0A1J5IPM9_9BACT|nr:MAG: hypothetical protein AUK40_06340 [Candidatus Wirthbacteria bacterium CG2_30_54_11]